MTTQQKKDYLRSFRKFQLAREVYWKPKFYAALMVQVHAGLNKEVISFEPLYTLLFRMYNEVATVWGHKVQLSIKRQQTKARQPIGFSQRLYEILKQQYGIDLMQDALDMTEYTKKLIAEVLTQSALEGFGIDEIVKRMEGVSEKRARTIARTETVAASNIAGDIIARDSGLAMNKEWMAILDQRTRHDHYNVHGMIVDINATFTVGVYQMRFPGDRQANVPGTETINCRCVCVYIVKTDERGLALAA